ncbi:hypothetical protein [uncultured Thermomonospora sp.]|uniref:hypothetical protein n=1 Tax=uncultured Thermomonospora sp. TaxID=671175 RepID=UPI00259B3142|nr:hypothetical protein [uncultured Thermomonospora sp.]
MYGSTIKIDRAIKLSRVGGYPRTCAAVLEAIPWSTINALTGRQLAELMDAIWELWQRTKRIHERDIINEGAVWDEASGRLIELGKPWRPEEAA